jgi:hypothetical protein
MEEKNSSYTAMPTAKQKTLSHQDIFQSFGFPESQDGWFFEDFAQFWVLLYRCPVLTNDV